MSAFNGSLIQDHHVSFGQSSDRKLAMPGMTDLAHYNHIQRQVQDLSNPGGHDDTASRQAEHEVTFDAPLLQIEAEFPASIFA